MQQMRQETKLKEVTEAQTTNPFVMFKCILEETVLRHPFIGLNTLIDNLF